jgi:hypothetical protein
VVSFNVASFTRHLVPGSPACTNPVLDQPYLKPCHAGSKAEATHLAMLTSPTIQLPIRFAESRSDREKKGAHL